MRGSCETHRRRPHEGGDPLPRRHPVQPPVFTGTRLRGCDGNGMRGSCETRRRRPHEGGDPLPRRHPVQPPVFTGTRLRGCDGNRMRGSCETHRRRPHEGGDPLPRSHPVQPPVFTGTRLRGSDGNRMRGSCETHRRRPHEGGDPLPRSHPVQPPVFTGTRLRGSDDLWLARAGNSLFVVPAQAPGDSHIGCVRVKNPSPWGRGLRRLGAAQPRLGRSWVRGCNLAGCRVNSPSPQTPLPQGEGLLHRCRGAHENMCASPGAKVGTHCRGTMPGEAGCRGHHPSLRQRDCFPATRSIT
jgi:hypothetical protein